MKQGGVIKAKASCRERVSESDGQGGLSEEEQPTWGRTDLRKEVIIPDNDKGLLVPLEGPGHRSGSHGWVVL